MQTNFVELANDAMAVNAKLINKSVDFNVKAAKNAVENATAQAGEMLQVKTLEDYATLQGKVVQNAIEQTNNIARTYVELGLETRDAYTALWQNYSVPAPIVPATKGNTAKKAA